MLGIDLCYGGKLVTAVLIGRVQATAALSVCPIACELAPNASRLGPVNLYHF